MNGLQDGTSSASEQSLQALQDTVKLYETEKLKEGEELTPSVCSAISEAKHWIYQSVYLHINKSWDK